MRFRPKKKHPAPPALFTHAIPTALLALAIIGGCRSSRDRRKTDARGPGLWLRTSAAITARDNRVRILDGSTERGVLLGVTTRPGRLDSGDPGVTMVTQLGGTRTAALPVFARDALWGPPGTVFFLDSEDRLFMATPQGQTLVDDRVWPGAALSPSGRSLVYVREPDRWITGLMLFDLDTLERRALVKGPGTNDRPAFTADGRYVVFVSGLSGVASLWMVETSGGPARQVTNRGLGAGRGRPPEGFVPVPTGARTLRCAERSCFFSTGGALVQVDLLGGQGRRIGPADAVLGLGGGRVTVRLGSVIQSIPVEEGP